MGQSGDSVAAFVAGFQCALRGVEMYDAERARLGRALTDAEVRRCAEFWVNPIRLVDHTSRGPSEP